MDADDNPLRIATGNLILDLNGEGANELTPTAAQTEGPYYPVVDFSGYDNNLNSTADDDEPVLPVLGMFNRFNLNTATGEEFLTIPNMSDRRVREFFEYRPYISISQFRREIGKYVDDTQVAAYEAFVYVPVDVNESDAATLMQIPGVDEAVAQSLMAARPFESNTAFLAALTELVSAGDLANAAHYLAAEA
jgi:radical SAM superfamily enzyme with C-terminal helix-hairpin-helix motif